MATRQDAIERIGATELDGGGWIHHADETNEYWVVSAAELDELAELMSDEDEQISGDAYSHWCAGGAGRLATAAEIRDLLGADEAAEYEAYMYPAGRLA